MEECWRYRKGYIGTHLHHDCITSFWSAQHPPLHPAGAIFLRFCCGGFSISSKPGGQLPKTRSTALDLLPRPSGVGLTGREIIHQLGCLESWGNLLEIRSIGHWIASHYTLEDLWKGTSTYTYIDLERT